MREIMSLEKFQKHMTYAIREYEFYNKLHDLYVEYRDVVGDAEAPFSNGGNEVIELLEEIFELPRDSFGYTTLSWWAYECDYGKNKGMLQSFELEFLPPNHKYRKPKLDTIEELYHFIVWESEYYKKKGVMESV